MRKQLGRIKDKKLATRYRRKLSIRSTLIGDKTRPRICTTKSNKHLRVQVVDDSIGKVLFSVQTYGKAGVEGGKTLQGAKNVGAKVGEQLKAKGLEKAVFDRSGYKYTGVIAAIADTIRESGIQI